ncbi:MAG: bifunctional oligoribonuclease/PAP phosphatase NrnA [Ruminiclostridium sp.]
MKLKSLLDFNDIVIQCHNYPDADTIASGFGVYRYLKNNGKNPRLVYSGDKQITKANLVIMISQLEIPLEYVKELEKPELLVTVDCIHGESNVKNFEAENYAAIDHHQELKSIPLLSEIRSNYGSCSTIVAEMLKDEEYPLSDDIQLSTALYYGLYTDTANLTEISHPRDRDLRDFARTDKSVLTLLMNSILSLSELRIAGIALNKAAFNDELRYAMVVAEPCDPNILGYINDLILQVDSIDVSVVGCYVSRGFRISVRSCITDIHADELASFITGGNGGGHKQKAGGMIYAEQFDNPETLLDERIKSYFDSFDVIRAGEYKADISDMKLYSKLPETIGYAKTADIVKAGTDIRIRMIEADLDIRASKNTYIMIGRKGNIYPIDKRKFLATYTATEEPYEIKAEYSPSVITADSVIPVADHAKRCTSKESGTAIYAKKLDRTLKLYTIWDKANYMLGNVGDYLAVRSDDINDMYIIPKEQFDFAYREVK